MKRGIALAALALFAASAVALTGSAEAQRAATIGSAQIKNNSIQLADISARAERALRGRHGPRGRQGPAGEAGPQGPAGAQGPAGTAGVLGYEVRETIVPQSTETTKSAFATCPAPKRVIGGGAITYLGGGSSNTVPVALTQNGPFGTALPTQTNGWLATGVSVNGYTGQGAMTVWAICATIPT